MKNIAVDNVFFQLFDLLAILGVTDVYLYLRLAMIALKSKRTHAVALLIKGLELFAYFKAIGMDIWPIKNITNELGGLRLVIDND